MSMDPAALDRHITGNYGEDFMREPGDESDPECPTCGCTLDQHREESREDKYGGDHEYIACPPESVRDDEKALAHWVKTGCYDLMPVTGDDGDGDYCDGCGDDL